VILLVALGRVAATQVDIVPVDPPDGEIPGKVMAILRQTLPPTAGGYTQVVFGERFTINGQSRDRTGDTRIFRRHEMIGQKPHKSLPQQRF
jgi:hypothetical protein